MARLDLRCAANVPVRFSTTDIGSTTYDTFTRDVGLFGTFVNSGMNLPRDFHVDLEMQLPSGPIKVRGRVLRKDDNGIAVKFTGLDGDSRQHLWDFLHGRIGENTKSCPFCNVQVPYRAERCPECGMFIDFRHEEYMDIYKNDLLSIRSTELDEAVEKFNSEMDEIEKRFLLHKEDANLMAKLVGESIHRACDACREFEEAAGIRSELVRVKQDLFRKGTDRHCSQSYFANHARTWPRGYPGDFEILENIYRNVPLSRGIGQLLDIHFLSTTLTIAVKERLSTLKELLKKELEVRSAPKVMDIACGPCREVFELAPQIGTSNAIFTCIDLDPQALEFSLDRLSYTTVLSNINLRRYNALKMISEGRVLKDFGKHDVIYSTGLFDYLTDGILVKLIKSLYTSLAPGGTLIASFKDCNRYKTQEYHWFTKWDAFFQRTEAESFSLFLKAGISRDKINTLRERSGVIIFFVVEKE